MAQRKSSARQRRHKRPRRSPKHSDRAPAPEPVVVTIERLAAGGDGVARLEDGRALFVPFTVQGDRARVRIVEERARFARAELLEVLEPGSARVQPVCPVFGRCGGCSWQHIDYAEQLAAKRGILRDALTRIGGFEISDDLAFTASPKAYGYRQRARVRVESGGVGFRAAGTHELCATGGRCPVLLPELETALTRWCEEGGQPLSQARQPGEWEIVLGSSRFRAIHLDSRNADADGAIEMSVGAEQLSISPGVFAQANALLLSDMAAAVCRAALGEGADSAGVRPRVLELFAGAGSLTLPLARGAQHLIAVESNRAAAADLQLNVQRAGLDHVEVRCQPTEDALAVPHDPPADVVVLDPPRAGLGLESAEKLAGLQPRRIVYLSCDPATLARDLKVLAGCDYRMVSIEGFDLFPQTAHVEALAVMER